MWLFLSWNNRVCYWFQKLASNDVHEGNDVHNDDAMVDEEISRANMFSKCYTKDGNTSNPIVVEALV